MCGHRTDHQGGALLVDAAQLGYPREIDQRGRVGEALLHGRDQRVAAREQLCLCAARQQFCRVGQRLRTMIFKGVHGAHSYSAAILVGAFWAARQTLSGVAGMAICSWPSASVMALMTAAGA